MGKPSPTRDTSFSWNYNPRYIAHKVSMLNKNNPDSVVPKMAKQNFAFAASLRTRMLTWKAIPEVLHNEAQRAGACVGTSCHGTINIYENHSCANIAHYTAPGKVTNEKCKQQIINAAKAAGVTGQTCCIAMGYENIATEVSNIGCAGMPSNIKCPH